MSSSGSIPKTRVTIRDIARRANVSASTVSRTLNNYPYVGDSTRRLVRQAAAELGYQLDNLRSERPAINTITLLIREEAHYRAVGESASDSVERLIMQGIQAVLDAEGINSYLQRGHYDQDTAVRFIHADHIDGVIMLGGQVHNHFVHALQVGGLPFVIAGSHVLPMEVNAVMANVRYGIQLAVDHLVAGGRRRIGLVNGPDLTTTSLEKLEGLICGLIRNSLPYLPEDVTAGYWNSESGYLRTLALLQERPDLDALIYSFDLMAIGGMRALREMGKRIPDDIAVVGCHNTDVVRYTDPPMTSIGFDMYRVGVLAAQRLLNLLDDPNQESTLTIVPSRLLIRGST
ncbi:MAG: LacI family transcriptional regulator [Anaerolineae bacterium]|nr:LacI family transcriptional regulator [Anaerolineae bacterium]